MSLTTERLSWNWSFYKSYWSQSHGLGCVLFFHDLIGSFYRPITPTCNSERAAVCHIFAFKTWTNCSSQYLEPWLHCLCGVIFPVCTRNNVHTPLSLQLWRSRVSWHISACFSSCSAAAHNHSKHVEVWKAVASVKPGGEPSARCLCNYTFEVQEASFTNST